MTNYHVIRAVKDFPGYGGKKLLSFKKGMYICSHRYSAGRVLPFENVTVFKSKNIAKKYLKNELSSSLFLSEDYFEIVPILEPGEVKKREPKYKNGDFVCFYEGMGECGYGTIICKDGANFKIQEWTHDPVKYPSHIRTVTLTDMRDKCTPEDAMDYYLERSGQKQQQSKKS